MADGVAFHGGPQFEYTDQHTGACQGNRPLKVNTSPMLYRRRDEGPLVKAPMDAKITVRLAAPRNSTRPSCSTGLRASCEGVYR